MIVTKKRDEQKILNELPKDKPIAILSCDKCAKLCKTGGQEGLEFWKNKLNATETHLLAPACSLDELKKESYNTNTILLLACDACAFSFKKMFPEKEIIQGTTTLGLGAFDLDGSIHTIKEFK